MSSGGYFEPVSRLLTFGAADWDDWEDYSQFKFTSENIPELIRMGTDEHLLLDEDVSDEAVWAPMHAWRALTQLYAVEAIPPMVKLFSLIEESESDLISEGLLDVIVAFGPPAIEPLTKFLFEEKDGSSGLVAAGESLSHISGNHPEYRDRIVHIITATLEARGPANPKDINGFWIADLLDLNAVESYPVIKQAFDEGRVNERIAGDLEEVEIELGLRTERSTPSPFAPFQEAMRLGFAPKRHDPDMFSIPTSNKDTAKKKAKRKQERKSRKKNRKKI
jgi:hypothetical protein